MNDLNKVNFTGGREKEGVGCQSSHSVCVRSQKHSWLTEAVTAPSGSPPVPLCVSDLRSFDFTALSTPAPTGCGQNTRVRACFMNISPDTNTSRFRGNFQEYSSGKVNSLAQKHFLLTRALKQLLYKKNVKWMFRTPSASRVRRLSPPWRKEFAKYFVGIVSACVLCPLARARWHLSHEARPGQYSAHFLPHNHTSRQTRNLILHIFGSVRSSSSHFICPSLRWNFV